MAQVPQVPELTPQFCFNTLALRGAYFLRISRGSIDDSITQNLNALQAPSTTGFDPSSTGVRNPRGPNPRRIDSIPCQNFKAKVLFPSWQVRSDVLNYCASVATSPDPDDPELIAREVEGQRYKKRIVDERLDPYSARFFPKEPRTEMLASVIRQEIGVESIIRASSWGLVVERCGGESGDWEKALGAWKSGLGFSKAGRSLNAS